MTARACVGRRNARHSPALLIGTARRSRAARVGPAQPAGWQVSSSKYSRGLLPTGSFDKGAHSPGAILPAILAPMREIRFHLAMPGGRGQARGGPQGLCGKAARGFRSALGQASHGPILTPCCHGDIIGAGGSALATLTHVFRWERRHGHGPFAHPVAPRAFLRRGVAEHRERKDPRGGAYESTPRLYRWAPT